jgi:hypothetical protein
MPTPPRRSPLLIAVALSAIATLTTAATALAGGAPGPWPR